MSATQTYRSLGAFLLIVLAALCGCDGGTGAPAAPDGTTGGTMTDPGTGETDPTPPPPANRVIFADPDSSFSTTDVYDVNEDIVRFTIDTQAIVWVADGREFQPGSWGVDGNLLRDQRNFQVRFGTVAGQRRAFFTETATATLCDLVADGNSLLIFPTSVLVPQ